MKKKIVSGFAAGRLWLSKKKILIRSQNVNNFYYYRYYLIQTFKLIACYLNVKNFVW